MNLDAAAKRHADDALGRASERTRREIDSATCTILGTLASFTALIVSFVDSTWRSGAVCALLLALSAGSIIASRSITCGGRVPRRELWLIVGLAVVAIVVVVTPKFLSSLVTPPCPPNTVTISTAADGVLYCMERSR